MKSANRNSQRKQKKRLQKKYIYRRLFLIVFLSVIIIVALIWVFKMVGTSLSNVQQTNPEVSAHIAVPTDTGVIMGPPLGASFSEERRNLLDPAPENPYGWELILVSTRSNLPQNFEVELERIQENLFLDKRIVTEFKQMVVKAKEGGISVRLVNAYVDPLEQEEKYNAEVEKHISKGDTPEAAHNKAKDEILPPWQSEHQTGLGVDLDTLELEENENFEETLAFKWLSENAHKYGFILRYPKEKESQTGKSFSSSHFRYVGVGAAEMIYKNSYCLEEYLDAKAEGRENIVISELEIDIYEEEPLDAEDSKEDINVEQ